MKLPFLKCLKQRVLLCDGAMGTMLYGKGIFINRCFDELNLTNPDLIQDIHRRYLSAGAQMIETNTFGANRIKLTGFGLADKTGAINTAGARLAQSCVGDDIYVAGSIGPLGIRIEPWGKMAIDEAKELFKEQISGLMEGGVDLLMLETFSDLNEIQAAMMAVREMTDLPLVAQMTLEDDGNSLEGTPPEIFGRKMDEWGADVIGLNCSVGPQTMLESIERIADVTTRPLSTQPNAGRPKIVEGRNIYMSSPEYMASYAKRFVRNGVKIVGGCCGTTPDHTRAVGRVLQSTGSPHVRMHAAAKSARKTLDHLHVVPPKEKSFLANTLLSGEFVTGVEISPPRGFDWPDSLRVTRELKAGGADVIHIQEGSAGGARMSSSALAIILQRESEIETVLDYSCRNQDLLAMQSDLLGLCALGIRNLLLITGDPDRLGDFQDATAVFGVDSIGVTNMVHALNEGFDLGGNRLSRPTRFFVGAGVNPTAVNLVEEVKRFEYKVEAGTEFCVTQPVFDVPALESFLKRVERHRVPLMARVLLLTSYRHAEFLNNEVPGVVVPDRMMERMRQADTKEEACREGVAIAREIVAELKSMVQGIRISTSSAGTAEILKIMETLESGSTADSTKIQEN